MVCRLMLLLTHEFRRCLTQGCMVFKVVDLINREIGGWDVGILKDLFEEQHVNAILKFPLSRFGGRDRLIWSGSLDGNLDVKYAYFEARIMLKKPCPRRDERSQVWKKLWSSNFKSPCQALFMEIKA